MSEGQTTYWASRLSSIESRLQTIPALLERAPNYATNKERYEQAVALYNEAKQTLAELQSSEEIAANADLRIKFFTALLAADVEMDYINHPDIDPNTGWVNLQGITRNHVANPIQIDTQLLNVEFSPDFSGTIRSIGYKPRKICLCNSYHLSDSVPFLSAQIFHAKDQDELFAALEANRKSTAAISKQPQLLKHTPSLASFRFMNELAPGISLVKDYSFKSGVGAHLQNSTTGFQLEYWTEITQPISADTFLIIGATLLLQTPAAEAYSLRALTSVGGATDNAWPLDTAWESSANATPGGLHGARIVDSIKNLVVDFRSAKPLHAALVRPSFFPNGAAEEDRLFQGFEIFFAQRLSQVSDLSHANTIFLSIA